MVSRLILGGALLAILAVVGCGGDEKKEPEMFSLGGDADASTTSDGDECVDEDGDGYGLRCEAGKDCDDTDPDVLDECFRCFEPAEGCPCEPGTMPEFCTPEAVDVIENGVHVGRLVCEEGAFYCRDSQWSACEAVSSWVLVPNN
ncbi:MAG: hypothetical protein OEZ06_01860 [Myxococcales bacterium]|nr:hypothetical protein [Myxococcales bacterium]